MSIYAEFQVPLVYFLSMESKRGLKNPGNEMILLSLYILIIRENIDVLGFFSSKVDNLGV